jgi:NRPS condensation-like uncharacterized protein
MQFYFREYNDATMRSAVFYDGIVDVGVFKKALEETVKNFPIINSRFIRNPIKSYWRINEKFDISDFFEVYETNAANDGDRVNEFITGQINPLKGPQFKAAIFRKTDKGKKTDCIALLFCHMVADGSGFSLFMKALSDTYTNMLKNPDYKCKYHMGDRNYKQFYKYLSDDDKKRATKMTNYRHEKNERLKLPLEQYKEGFKRRILTYNFDGFGVVRKYCKDNGFTFNDVVMSAYLIALMKHIKPEENQSLAFDCVLNLRRYMPADEEVNFCNLVSKVKVSVGNGTGKELRETCAVVHEFMEKSKDNLGGLGGLSLLNLMDRVFPFEIGKILIKIFYENPLIGISNIGKLDKDAVSYGGLNVNNVIMTGAVKYAPYMMLSLITFEDRIYFTIPVACSDGDVKIFEELLGDISELLNAIKKQYR